MIQEKIVKKMILKMKNSLMNKSNKENSNSKRPRKSNQKDTIENEIIHYAVDFKVKDIFFKIYTSKNINRNLYKATN